MMLSLIWNNRQEEQEPVTLCSDPVHIPLTSAYLCQDCNSVGNCSTQCPACASTALMNLSTVLNRDVDAVVEELEYEYIPARRLSAFEEVAA
jgi:ferredoxin